MELPPELVVIHEPVRLRICTLLYRQTDLGFGAIRDTLGLTAGNLASHASKLAEAGLVDARDVLTRTGFEKRLQITAEGIRRFEAYLHVLDTFLGAARAGEPAPAKPARVASRGQTVVGALLAGAFFMGTEAAVKAFSDTSGSEYFGIGAAGLMMFVLAPLQQILRLRWRGP